MRSTRLFIDRCRHPWWAVLLLASTAAACLPSKPEPPVRVVLSTLVGTGSGLDVIRGTRLALDEAGGRAGSRGVELVVVNTLDLGGEQPLSLDLERQTAGEAAADPRVVAYLGPMASHQAKVSMPILNRASLAQVSSSATWPGLTRAGFGAGEPGIYYPTGRRHFFRLAATDDEQAAAAARWAADLGFRSAFLVDNALAYGRGLSGIFEETARDLGIDIVGRHSLELGGADPASLDGVAAAVAEAQPEMIFYGGGIERRLLELFRRVRARLPRVAFLATEGLQRAELITNLGPEVAEGFRATSVYLPVEQTDTEAARRFRQRFVAAYEVAPAPLAASSYEAMKVVLWAIEHAREPTREGVLEALSAMGEIDGLAGPWRFDERGDSTVHTISGYRVVSGRWVFDQVLH